MQGHNLSMKSHQDRWAFSGRSSALFGQTLVLILHLLPLADLLGCSKRSDFILWDYLPEIRINCMGAANVLTISVSGLRVTGDL